MIEVRRGMGGGCARVMGIASQHGTTCQEGKRNEACGREYLPITAPICVSARATRTYPL